MLAASEPTSPTPTCKELISLEQISPMQIFVGLTYPKRFSLTPPGLTVKSSTVLQKQFWEIKE